MARHPFINSNINRESLLGTRRLTAARKGMEGYQ